VSFGFFLENIVNNKSVSQTSFDIHEPEGTIEKERSFKKENGRIEMLSVLIFPKSFMAPL